MDLNSFIKLNVENRTKFIKELKYEEYISFIQHIQYNNRKEITKIWGNKRTNIFYYLLLEPGLFAPEEDDIWFGTFLQKLEIELDFELNDIITSAFHAKNGFIIKINPVFFIFLLNIKEQIAILKHEVSHILNNHYSRFIEIIDKLSLNENSFTKEQYNILASISMDMSINQYLHNMPRYNKQNEQHFYFSYLPEDFYLYRNETAENYFNSLISKYKYDKKVKKEIDDLFKIKKDFFKIEEIIFHNKFFISNHLELQIKFNEENTKEENSESSEQIKCNIENKLQSGDMLLDLLKEDVFLENKDSDSYSNMIIQELDKIKNKFSNKKPKKFESKNKEKNKEKIKDFNKAKEKNKNENKKIENKTLNNNMEEIKEYAITQLVEKTKNDMKDFKSGNIPNSLSNIFSLKEKKTDSKNWKQLLKFYIGKNISSKRRNTFMKRHLLFPDEPYIPGKIKNNDDPFIYIILDTSGSMDKNDYEIAINEIKTITKSKKAKLKLILADTQIHSVINIDKNFKEVELKGFGGTEMFPAINILFNKDKQIDRKKLKINKKPDLVIIITDGGVERSWPIKYDENIIWLVTYNRLIFNTKEYKKHKTVFINKPRKGFENFYIW